VESKPPEPPAPPMPPPPMPGLGMYWSIIIQITFSSSIS
jgi:hypothetical protein